VPDYIALLQEMCDDFDLFLQGGNYALTRVRDPAQVTLLGGLNSHAHYMVRRCLPLLAETAIAAIPIVRSVFECGVMAQWLLWVPGSEMALLNECRRQMEQLTKYHSRSETPHYREGAAAAAAHRLFAEWPEKPPAQAGVEICDAFYGGG
jgi:hypothetical protein